MSKTIEIKSIKGDTIFSIIEIVDKLQVADTITEFLKQREETKTIMAKKIGYDLILEKNPDSKEAKEAVKENRKIEKELNDRSFDVIEVAMKLVLSNMKNAKTEINQFLADITNEDLKTIENLGMVPYIKLVKDFFGIPEIKELQELFLPSDNSETQKGNGGSHSFRTGVNKFRDVLFKRYSDVFFLLRSMTLDNLPQFIETMVHEYNDEKLREIWLSNPFQEKNFKEWKQENLNNAVKNSKSKELIAVEAEIGMTQALEKIG